VAANVASWIAEANGREAREEERAVFGDRAAQAAAPQASRLVRTLTARSV
jgi:hypothetical protein